uniref:Uncharacterized protein n=1 Tax=Rousettus aegyptiacus TaxID=9407 RepID=A0A7J8B9P4_ROUAE|nr:hypothetical protein HJG63_009970 [Rousettus aegyptiacus]
MRAHTCTHAHTPRTHMHALTLKHVRVHACTCTHARTVTAPLPKELACGRKATMSLWGQRETPRDPATRAHASASAAPSPRAAGFRGGSFHTARWDRHKPRWPRAPGQGRVPAATCCTRKTLARCPRRGTGETGSSSPSLVTCLRVAAVLWIHLVNKTRH